MIRQLKLFLLSSTLLLALCGQTCNPERVESHHPKPGAPTLDSVILTTQNDRLPGIQLFFSDTNSMAVTYSIFKKGPTSTHWTPIVISVPQDRRTYFDRELPTQFFEDHDGYHYRLQACSLSDSVSDFSDSVTLFLIDTSPVIDSILLETGFPRLYAHISGQERGLDYHLEITDSGKVVAFFSKENQFGDNLSITHLFSELFVDSLKAASQVLGRNGTYGVRLRVIIPTSEGEAFGIAADTFNVFQP